MVKMLTGYITWYNGAKHVNRDADNVFDVDSLNVLCQRSWVYILHDHEWITLKNMSIDQNDISNSPKN